MSDSVPAEWSIVRLNQIGQLKNGINKGKEDFGFGTKFVNIIDAYQSKLKIEKLGRLNASEKDIKEYSLTKGDIIFVRSSVKPEGVGYPILFNNHHEPVVYCGFMIRFRPETKNISSEYLLNYFRFESFRKELMKVASISANTNVNQENLGNLIAVLPPLPEQQKIASILTSVDTVIEKTETQINKLKDLKRAMMQELLTKGIGHTEFKDSPVGKIPKGWTVQDFGNLMLKIEGGGTPARNISDYWNGNIPWATVKDLTDTYLKRTQEYISELGLKQSSSKLIPAGTIIIATRMAVGRVVVFDRDVAINQDLKAVFPKNDLNALFLLYWFQEKSNYLESIGVGSTVKGIRLEDINAISVSLPPLPEQKKITSILISIETHISEKQSKLTHTKSLKKALMQDLLTGKIRVKV